MFKRLYSDVQSYCADALLFLGVKLTYANKITQVSVALLMGALFGLVISLLGLGNHGSAYIGPFR